MKVFPVSQSLLSSASLLKEVEQSYTIGHATSCELLRSFVNDTYLVTTTRGRYVLKVYRAGWRSSSDVTWELELLSHLFAKGVGVAQAITRRDNQLMGILRAPEGLRQIVLFPYAVGAKPKEATRPIYYHVGRATASLHLASDDFSSPHPRFHLDLAYLLDAPLAALQPWLAHRPSDWEFLAALAEKIRARIMHLAAHGLDWGVCHGDLTLDNLHIAPANHVTLYDFDSGGWGWRACDLYGMWLTSKWKDDDGLWDAFAAGYHEVRTLSDADIAALPYVVPMCGIWSMGCAVTLWTRWRGRMEVNDSYFDREMARWREWDAEQIETTLPTRKSS